MLNRKYSKVQLLGIRKTRWMEGHVILDEAQMLNWFFSFAGMGAVGSEVLKNWVLMGVGAGETGSITLADGDAVQAFNPTRQCLFRASDVGRSKVRSRAI